MARALDGVSEKDHFGSDAFVANGRIFATVWHDKNVVNLMLNPEQQRRYLSIDGEGFVEIDNAWGRAGATQVQLEFVDRRDFAEALKEAWTRSAMKHAPLGQRKAAPKKTTAKKATPKKAAAKKATAKKPKRSSASARARLT